MELDASLRSFYRRDARRARSSERDLGLRWRDRGGSTYRAAWIEDTEELYAVRHGQMSEEDRVTVLARAGIEAIERELAGWREVLDSDEPGTYEWLRDHAAAVAEE